MAESRGTQEHALQGPGGCLSCDDGRKGDGKDDAPSGSRSAGVAGKRAGAAGRAAGRTRKVEARLWFPGKRLAAQVIGEVENWEGGGAEEESHVGGCKGRDGRQAEAGEQGRPETPPTPPPMLHVLKRGPPSAATPGVIRHRPVTAGFRGNIGFDAAARHGARVAARVEQALGKGSAAAAEPGGDREHGRGGSRSASAAVMSGWRRQVRCRRACAQAHTRTCPSALSACAAGTCRNVFAKRVGDASKR